MARPGAGVTALRGFARRAVGRSTLAKLANVQVVSESTTPRRRAVVKIRLLLCVFLVGLGTTAGATLVAPPSLDELVARADLVFEGTVVDVRSSWRETREGRVIMSDVTFRVARGF